MPKETPQPITLNCPVCGAASTVATRWKGWQLWQRWYGVIADLAARSIKNDPHLPERP